MSESKSSPTTSSTTPSNPNQQVPRGLIVAVERPAPVVQDWSRGLLPSLCLLVFWFPVLDGLAVRTPPARDLPVLCLTALIVGVLAYALLIEAPGRLGLRTGRPLELVAADAFGGRGALMIPTLVSGLILIGIFAVGLRWAVDLTLLGLRLGGLIGPDVLSQMEWAGQSWPSLVFLVTAGLWSIVVALGGGFLIRILTPLMSVGIGLAALLMGVQVLLRISDLPGYRDLDPLFWGTNWPNRWVQAGQLAQWLFGLASLAGIMAVDWGRGLDSLGALRRGGLVGLTANLTIATVLSYLAAGGLIGALGQAPLTLRVGLINSPSWLGATTALVFGLLSAGSACASAFVLSHRFKAVLGGKRIVWVLAAALASWPLILGDLTDRLDLLLGLAGGLLGPAVGVLTGSGLARGFRWSGVHGGVMSRGAVAWFVGTSIGLVQPIATIIDGPEWLSAVPTAILGTLAALFVFLILRSGTNTPVIWTATDRDEKPSTPSSLEPSEPIESGVAQEPGSFPDANA